MNSCDPAFLIVEDNELDYEKLTRGFRRLNITNECVRARDGVEALQVLRGAHATIRLEQPCVVLLDLNMPRMNGLEFLQEVRGDPNIARVPVVVISTSNRSSDVRAAYDHHVSGYLVKPMQIEEMHKALVAISTYWQICELPPAPA